MLTFLVQEQGQLILELVSFNQRTHHALEDLNARLTDLEAARPHSAQQQQQVFPPILAAPFQPVPAYRASDDQRSRSPSPDQQSYRIRHSASRAQGRKGKGRKVLEIKIPGKMYAGPAAGLPTPLSLSAVCLSMSRASKTPKSLQSLIQDLTIYAGVYGAYTHDTPHSWPRWPSKWHEEAQHMYTQARDP
jgi:hypothetical protein